MSINQTEINETNERFTKCVQERRIMLSLLESVKNFLPSQHQIAVDDMANDQDEIESYVSSLNDETVKQNDARMKADAEQWANNLPNK